VNYAGVVAALARKDLLLELRAVGVGSTEPTKERRRRLGRRRSGR
jgi:hypothetical protein